ncbi:MAG TPA: CHASE2 domain-containing protein [Verrucomicrobiae bacterium]|nr:CHASE2 domain-containing protein [Verrucomicrobiae bacterium]
MRFSFRVRWNSTVPYAGLLAASFALALGLGWNFGPQLNDWAYDSMFLVHQPAPRNPQAVVLAIDELTLMDCGGIRGVRTPLARALNALIAARPKVIALDVILADRADPLQDEALAAALRQAPNVVLASELIDDDRQWEDPRPEFRAGGAALAHVSVQPDNDHVTRKILLQQVDARHNRRWALALQAFLVSRGVDHPIEYPTFTKLRGGLVGQPLSAAGVMIPQLIDAKGLHSMRVRFAKVPRVSLKRFIDNPSPYTAQLAGKAVFIGVTATSEIRDRLSTPIGQMPGIEINASAFETMAQQAFVIDVAPVWEYLVSIGLLVAIGLAFRHLPGWWAYTAGAALLALATLIPYLFFLNLRVFPFATSASVAWLGTLTAASYYHLVVRRNLRIEQTSRERYQQAMHFVTHEMRTPLSAIQGSSELISRYALPEEKRKQIAEVINSESKRLARMVEIFLNVERLTAGQMELKQEPISVRQMMDVCMTRVRPLADRKHIGVTLEPVPDDLHLTGDRELMEYACYNLLTNAVKYSPQHTQVTASAWRDDARIRIAVKDQGIGMDQKEVKQIFQKFYRTKKAEESGEAGTGIGLSIVQQIVEQHGGRIEVTSRPGAGSCFVLVMPARTVAAVPAAVERK